MPLYEYKCTVCHKHTEKRQKFSDTEITECPFCGGKLERVITAPAIAFKGGGWYKDGYGNAKPAATNSGEGPGAADSSSTDKSTDKSADKPATPAAAATPASTSTPAPAAPAASPSSSSSDK